MTTDVIRDIRDIIAGEMPAWCWFSDPEPEAINRSTLQFRLGCEDTQLPEGRRQRRLRIDLTKELVEQVAALTDDQYRDGVLNAIRREISGYFEQLSAQPRITEWLLTEDISPELTDRRVAAKHRDEAPHPQARDHSRPDAQCQ